MRLKKNKSEVGWEANPLLSHTTTKKGGGRGLKEHVCVQGPRVRRKERTERSDPPESALAQRLKSPPDDGRGKQTLRIGRKKM